MTTIQSTAMTAIRDCLETFSNGIDIEDSTAPEKVEALQYALARVLIGSASEDSSAFNAAACAGAMTSAIQQALVERIEEIQLWSV
tara:strand:+ start:96 stop:353 length:258 start_codon:yes stop_codon:yes gene_type:complete